MLKIISWNVNGLRAAHGKGLMDWMARESPDILCLQEIKAREDQIPFDLRYSSGYRVYANPSDRGGYSGVATLSKEGLKDVRKGFGDKRFDSEGRVLSCDLGFCLLYNVYFPNGGASEDRLRYKLEFYDAFLRHLDSVKASGTGIIVCGDYNTAHKEIDIARPKENENNSGFMKIEREWLDRLVEHGFTDTFRMFNSEPGQYTWWDQKTKARDRNVGWRLDYFFASEDLKPRIKAAYIMADVQGSDHCPVGLELL